MSHRTLINRELVRPTYVYVHVRRGYVNVRCGYVNVRKCRALDVTIHIHMCVERIHKLLHVADYRWLLASVYIRSYVISHAVQGVVAQVEDSIMGEKYDG